MEDFILREIDRLGEMLTLVARRLGLLRRQFAEGQTPYNRLMMVEVCYTINPWIMLI